MTSRLDVVAATTAKTLVASTVGGTVIEVSKKVAGREAEVLVVAVVLGTGVVLLVSNAP